MKTPGGEIIEYLIFEDRFWDIDLRTPWTADLFVSPNWKISIMGLPDSLSLIILEWSIPYFFRISGYNTLGSCIYSPENCRTHVRNTS